MTDLTWVMSPFCYPHGCVAVAHVPPVMVKSPKSFSNSNCVEAGHVRSAGRCMGAQPSCVTAEHLPQEMRTASQHNGGCVEAEHLPTEMRSASTFDGSCVTAGQEPGGEWVVADSKNPGPHLHVSEADWEQFKSVIRSGQHEHFIGLLLFAPTLRVEAYPVLHGKENATWEVAFSQDDDADVLRYTPGEWTAFVRGVRETEVFDLVPA